MTIATVFILQRKKGGSDGIACSMGLSGGQNSLMAGTAQVFREIQSKSSRVGERTKKGPKESKSEDEQ